MPVMAVCVFVVVMAALQYDGTDDIHDKTYHRNRNGLSKLNRLRRDQARY
jgi:hypothetical protein